MNDVIGNVTLKGIPSAFEDWFSANIKAPILSFIDTQKFNGNVFGFKAGQFTTTSGKAISSGLGGFYNKLVQTFSKGTDYLTNSNKRRKTFEGPFMSIKALFVVIPQASLYNLSFGNPAIFSKFSGAFGSMGSISNNVALVSWRNKIQGWISNLRAKLQGTQGYDKARGIGYSIKTGGLIGSSQVGPSGSTGSRNSGLGLSGLAGTLTTSGSQGSTGTKIASKTISTFKAPMLAI